MNYQKNKERAKTRPTKPTQTDQASAKETDINVIVKNFTVHGQAPGTTQQPMYANFADLPRDLRGFIELGRSMQNGIKQLPKQLSDLTMDELFALTREQITAKLTPPQPEAKTETKT